MRRPVIAGNWKMNLGITQTGNMLRELLRLVHVVQDVDIIVAPPFTSLTEAKAVLSASNIKLAAQNASYAKEGAFTGEISPLMLKEIGCKYVILGHSERRQLFLETNEVINKKIKNIFEEQMMIIFCIGETLEEREADRTFEVIKTQLKEGLKGVNKEDLDNMIIAYEPVWAIGTGKTASNEQAKEVHKYIRSWLKKTYDDKSSEAMRILYGGSVKPGNIAGLMIQENIDGALVGGASLEAATFSEIVRYNR